MMSVEELKALKALKVLKASKHLKGIAPGRARIFRGISLG
jgi:hypothetical protein